MESKETEQFVKIKPLGDKVVIQVVEETSTTPGGIFIPDSVKGKPEKGIVLAVGPGPIIEGGQRGKMEVKLNDLILFSKHGGTDVKIDNVDYKILSIRDILGILG